MVGGWVGDSWHILKQGKFRHTVRKKCFPYRDSPALEPGPRELVPSAPLEGIESQPDKILSRAWSGDLLWSLPNWVIQLSYMWQKPVWMCMCGCSLGSTWHTALFWDSNYSTQAYWEYDLLFQNVRIRQWKYNSQCSYKVNAKRHIWNNKWRASFLPTCTRKQTILHMDLGNK